MEELILYFIKNLNWNFDLEDFDEIEDITYDFEAADIGLKEEAFAKISSLRQLQPSSDVQKWGIFCVEFDSNKFEVSALRKILSGLVPKRRNSPDHAVWQQKDLLFLCFWGQDNNRTIGIAHFEDKEFGLPQIKMISCAPAVEDFTQIHNFEERIRHLSWADDETNTEAWYQKWSSAFVTAYHQVIRDSATLTVKLAAEAQSIRDRILDIYAVETKDGYVHKLCSDFRDNLIHDMTKQQFADMYAQTVVYGLFSAKCMSQSKNGFNVKEAVSCIPNTNPFLKRLLEECLGENSERQLRFDELEVANVVELLTTVNTDVILKDFNRQTGGGKEDPVIHFYEEFLSAYDKQQKIQRGVYYTPQPVVNFIVRAVDSILKTEFGLADGLASEETKKIKVMRDKKRGTGEVEDQISVPAVQILDPATGTGTFLRQTILQIYENFRAKHKGKSEEQIKAAWNQYVPTQLLPRINGFEMMMAPYAVAHMKLAMILKDTGYDFQSDQRLNVFLTNSLEEAGKDDMQMSFFENDPLAFESAEANQAKKNQGINVIIGNPPYSGESANKGKWIMDLMEDYKKEPGGRIKLQERNPKWLNDDYVKFIRYAQTYIERAGNGILAYICPHGFLDNPTFRGMRWNLLQAYDSIYVLDLHGNVKKKETCPDGSKDENVFDIQQGVCIIIAVKKSTDKHDAKVYHADLFGTRELKYSFLNKGLFENIGYKEIQQSEPQYFFVPADLSLQEEFSKLIPINQIILLNSVGIVTSNDKVLIGKSNDEVSNKVKEYYAVESEHSLFSKYAYRPFDYKVLYYDTNLLERPRKNVMQHLLNTDNLSIIVSKINRQLSLGYMFISTGLTDFHILDAAKDSTYIFPLYQYNSDYVTRTVNIKEDVAAKLLQPIGIKYTEDMALQLFDYIYAVLYSPKYREKYKEFLKIDFPRVPYPTDKETFWKLVEIGSELRKCHLMQTEFDVSAYSFIDDGTNEVIKPEYKNGRVYINKTQYFDNVPQAQWEQYIGGYQPLQKWLKDRKKTKLSADDIEHYKKIIAALKRTEELMKEIDKIVEF